MTDKPHKEPRAPHRSRPERSDRRIPAHLDRRLVEELGSAVRPGKKGILVKVFGEAVAAFAEGDLDEAIRLGEQAKHLALRSPAAREFLGIVYYAAGRWRDCIRELSAFRRMAASVEQNPVLADSYRAEGMPEKAIELCDEMRGRAVPEAVRYEGAIVAAGAHTDMGRVEEAIARLEELDLNPGVAEEHHLRAWYVLGDLLERTGRFTQARRFFDAVATSDPGLTDAPERMKRLGS